MLFEDAMFVDGEPELRLQTWIQLKPNLTIAGIGALQLGPCGLRVSGSRISGVGRARVEPGAQLPKAAVERMGAGQESHHRSVADTHALDAGPQWLMDRVHAQAIHEDRVGLGPLPGSK